MMSIFGKHEKVAELDTAVKKTADEKKNEWEERYRKAEADLAELKKEDDAQREAAKMFVSPVRIEKCSTGPFLCCERVEIPCEFIESIKVTNPGSEPYLYHTPSFGFGISEGYQMAFMRPAEITIRMLSGGEHKIKCNRWNVDLMYEELMKAWRANR